MLLSVRPDSLIGACPPPRACGGDVGGSLIRSIADGLLTLHDLLELPPDVTLAPSPSSCAESKLPRRIGELPALPRGRRRRGQYDGLCEVVCGEAGGLPEWWVLANYWES